MAWVQVDQSLATHRKTLAALELLKIPDHLFIGHMVSLWWWALDNVDETGALNGVSDGVLDRAAGWVPPHPNKKAARSLAVVLRDTGFIDEVGFHNWPLYSGRLQSTRKANATRMRVARAGNVQDTKAARTGATVQDSTGEERTGQDKTGEETSSGRIFQLYEELCGSINPTTRTRLEELDADHPPECVEHSFAEAALQNARNLKYVTAIMERHSREGCGADSEAPTERAPDEYDEIERRMARGEDVEDLAVKG